MYDTLMTTTGSATNKAQQYPWSGISLINYLAKRTDIQAIGCVAHALFE